MAQTFLDGLSRTPRVFSELADSLGATPIEALRIVRITAALACGLRIGATYAPVGAVIGEWVGGAKGLGAAMIQASGRIKTDHMFTAPVLMVLIAVAFRRVVSLMAVLPDRYACG